MYTEEQHSPIVPARFSPEEIARREEYKCVHHHSGMSHKNCYNKENGIKERKGCLDIEASNLSADFGIMLSWAIKTSGEDETFYDHVTKKDLESGAYDSRIMRSLMDQMWQYDRIITHYGQNRCFDIPFVRSRYLWLNARRKYTGTRMPGPGEMWLSDTYAMSKRLLALSSRRQNVVANLVQGVDVKTPIDRDHWLAIQNGNSKQRREAIDYIVEHNLKDVEQLDANYLALVPFVTETRTSI